MARVEPPPSGWYPDPEGGSRLRWWLGTDWSDRYRPPPTPAELQRVGTPPAAGATPTTKTAPLVPGGGRTGLQRAEVDEIVAQVRQVARSEVDRAANVFERRARAATTQFQPLVTEYTNRILRWLKIAAVVVVVAVVAWFVFQAIVQVTFFEWLGDRIDNLTD